MYKKLKNSFLNLLFCLFVAITCMACGKRTKVTVVPDTPKESVSLFEGEYHMENNGYLELMDNGDEVLLLGTYVLNSINPKNGTLAYHPVVSFSKVDIVNDKILLIKDLTYNDGHDVEEDVSGDNIRGKKRTDIEISKDENGLLVLKITIYSNKISNNANYVIAERIIKEEL